jgi:pimeloyl-ACP methyl ester carboxylesterase
MERTTLEIPGFNGEPLPCVLHAEGGEEGVAVVFPGAAGQGYRLGGIPARPDLHYTRAVLLAEGVAVFEVWWDADTVPEGGYDAWIAANADAALAAATESHRLAALVGRSLGTIALAQIVSRGDWESRSVPTIWIAPLLHLPNVAEALATLASPAFVVGGTDDRAFDPAVVERARADGAEVVTLEGAHHGLEVADPAASARLLADLLDRMREFVRTTMPAGR